MSNLAKFELVVFDITKKNYLSCIFNAKVHLDAMSLGDAIKEINKAYELLQQQYREKGFHKYSEFIS